MHQLKALLWRSYKVRFRTYYTTLLDLLGPIVIVSIYLAIKMLLNWTHEVQLDEASARIDYFQANPGGGTHIDLRRDIRRHMCHKVLFCSSNNDGRALGSHLTNECGLELTTVSSRDELVQQLKESLDLRVAYQSEKLDLNKRNSSTDNCIKLPSSSETIFQLGLVQTGLNAVELHMTDSAGSSVIHMPYSQGSTYNEYKLPQSDLNSGTHLIEICLAEAYRRTIIQTPSPNPSTSPRPITSASAGASVSNTSTSPTPSSTPSLSRSTATTQTPTQTQAATNTITITRAAPWARANSINKNGSPDARILMTMTNNLTWYFKPYPVLTGVYVLPITTAISILIAYFCSNIATVLRISEANEFGLHRYARLCGLPACSNWLSLLAMAVIQNLMHSLIIAIMLGVPTGNFTYDPISETAVTVRWMLLFTYSLTATSHAIFLASLFDRSSHALLTSCMIGSMYAMYPLLIIHQWTPYGFKKYRAVTWFALLNPGSNFEALCAVLVAVAMQTNETFSWSHLSGRIIGGGFSDFSVGELWLLLLLQIVLWVTLTILIDQYRYSTTTNLLGFTMALANELCCCNYFGSQGARTTEDLKSKSPKSVKSDMSKMDPNRVCCSLRHVYVSGPTTLLPYTKGNPFRTSHKQLNALEGDGRTVSKTTQILLNRKQPSGASFSIPREEPIMIDESIRQNLIWYKTHIRFEELALDFRFNQISFILGQTDLKELLFATLLGLRPIEGGHVIIDGTKYTASTMSLARQQIGYLSEKDIFNNDLSIFENLQFYGSLREPSYKSYDSESLYVLSLLHLSSRKDDLPATLTHRSARKLALAVALVGYTKLLLLTEPTLNLRWRPRCQVHNLLKKYKSIRSIVIDTSDVDEAVSFGDRIVLLKNGTTDLNDSPRRLTKKLACGYWLVFEPTSGDGKYVDSAAIGALERLTNDIFKQDKLNLDATKRSIYQDLTGATTKSKNISQVGSRKSFDMAPLNVKSLETRDDMQRLIVIVKVQHTSRSSQALCTMLKMFANRNIYGFRLAQVSYESLEDILILRMSRAIYPDLPPDLLLSLQHRAMQSTNNATKTRESPISVRNMSSSFQETQNTTTTKPIFVANMATLLRDRLGSRSELLFLVIALICSFIIVIITLLSLRYSFRSEANFHHHEQRQGSITYTAIPRSQKRQEIADHLIIEHSAIKGLYKYRIGFYILERRDSRADSDGNQTRSIAKAKGDDDGGFMMRANVLENLLLKTWPGNKNLVGVLRLPASGSSNKSNALIVADLVDRSKDLAGSLIVLDPQRNEATMIFEPHLPHMLLATIKTFIDFTLSLNTASAVFDSTNAGDQMFSFMRDDRGSTPTGIDTSRHDFHHSWHEMIQGFSSRRLLYGIGFSIAEAMNVGVLVMAPIRHRGESRPARVGVRYWFKMAIVDLCFSSLSIAGYVFLFILIEDLNSVSLIYSMVIVLFLYKLASLPVPYLSSLVAESRYYGFLFILLLYLTVAWDMAIFIKAFINWTLISNDYLYTISNWILFALPITPLIDSLVVINQISVIEARCPDVPAYTATSNTVELAGIRRFSMVDSLLEKVGECLASGKTFVSTDVMHRQNLGILWSIYLILLFGLISWIFLLTSERLFGLIVRRFSSIRTSNDPMKTVVRLPDQTTRLFAWDKERDRLVSEYIKCMNELKYVRIMAKNCLILRIWLKPIDDQTSIDKRLAQLIEPLISLGHTRSEVKIELRTTLQIFIRIGDETKHCRADKINLIETYSKYVAAHSDSIAKFAVVDWSRENLYKILLHGHYNNKTTTTVGS